MAVGAKDRGNSPPTVVETIERPSVTARSKGEAPVDMGGSSGNKSVSISKKK